MLKLLLSEEDNDNDLKYHVFTSNADDDGGEARDEVDGGVIAGVDKPPSLCVSSPPMPGPGGVKQSLHQLLAFRFVITNHLQILYNKRLVTSEIERDINMDEDIFLERINID